MGWFKEEILDVLAKVIHKIDDLLGGAWSSLAHTSGFRYFTKAGLNLRYDQMSEEEKKSPAVKSAYDAALKDIEEGGMFGGLPEALFKGFDGLKDTIEGNMAELLKTSLKPGSPAVTEQIEGAMDGLLEGFLNIMDPDGDKISKELRTKFTDTMGPMMNLGLTFTVGTVLAELIHPTKEMGMGRIAHFLYDTVGFKALMDAYIDPIRTNLIKQPTKYAINELTTPFIPRWGDFVEWYGRGHVSEEQMEGAMGKHGIDKSYSWLYARMGTKPSSYFMLNAIGKEGLYNEEDFKFWLSDAGYGAFQITKANMSEYEKKYGLEPPSTTQIDFLAQSYKRMGERVEWMGMIPLAKKACREGLRDISFFQEQLKRSYRREEVNAIEIELLEGDIKEETDREYRKAYEKKYLSGRIEKDVLETKLKEHGLRPERARARVEYLVARKLGKLAVDEDEKVLSDARIINSYKYGLKEKMWAVKGLDDKGYTLEDAQLLVEAVEQKRRDDTGKEWIRVYEQRMKYNLITQNELESKYKELGKDAEWAEARAAYAYEKAVGAPEEMEGPEASKIKANITRERIRVIEQRAKYEEITKDELVAEYIKLGKDAEWAENRATYLFEGIEERVEVIEEAEEEKIKADITKEWIRVIEQRAKYGAISKYELAAEYIKLGKDAEWAENRATYLFERIKERVEVIEEAEVEKIKADITKEWIRVIEQRALHGMISWDELKAEYIKLGKDAEWAEHRAAYLLEKEMVKGEEG
jgi:hypothetical protein